jgi:hypothetical protein
MIGFATQKHRKRSPKPMLLKNKVLFFAFQDHFFLSPTPKFLSRMKKNFVKKFPNLFLKFFDKIICEISLGGAGQTTNP